MGTNLTTYAANNLRDAAFLGVSVTFPSSWWFALGDAFGVELVGTYTREAVTLVAGSDGQVVNSAAVSITPPTGLTAESLLLVDASTGGNAWLADDLPFSTAGTVTVDAGDYTADFTI